MVVDAFGADRLLLLTDVAAVELGHGTPEARPIGRITADELGEHRFDAGSMQPKVDAARWFASTTGGRAAIGGLHAAAALVRGEAGTQVVPSAPDDAVRSQGRTVNA